MIHRNFVLAFKLTAQAFPALVLAIVPLLVAAALSTAPDSQPKVPAPSPELDPSEVVRIQVEALRSNSLLNEGIQLTYRFASPQNKRFTGPLSRFIQMVRSAPYDRLLNHRSARYSPMVISGDNAHQIVIVTDREDKEIPYHWLLARQGEGEFRDCWMTNAVIVAETSAQREFVNMQRGRETPGR